MNEKIVHFLKKTKELCAALLLAFSFQNSLYYAHSFVWNK